MLVALLRVSQRRPMSASSVSLPPLCGAGRPVEHQVRGRLAERAGPSGSRSPLGFERRDRPPRAAAGTCDIFRRRGKPAPRARHTSRSTSSIAVRSRRRRLCWKRYAPWVANARRALTAPRRRRLRRSRRGSVPRLAPAPASGFLGHHCQLSRTRFSSVRSWSDFVCRRVREQRRRRARAGRGIPSLVVAARHHRARQRDAPAPPSARSPMRTFSASPHTRASHGCDHPSMQAIC